MSILELIIASGERGLRLGELSAALEAPKSSLHALVKGLLAAGYLREEDGRYVIGPAFAGLFAGVPDAALVGGRHVLAELAAEWNETIMLATLVGDSVVYVDLVESAQFIRAKPPVNQRLTLWPRSSGKVFLAAAEPKHLAGYLRRFHPQPGEADEVMVAVKTTRERGFGLNIDDSPAGHVGLAVPVRFGDRPVTTALALAGPRGRVEHKINGIVSSLTAAVAALT